MCALAEHQDVLLDRLRSFLRQHGSNTRLLHVALMGAHGCGYAAESSTYELKGIYIEATENLLGLSEAPRTINWIGEFEGCRVDYTAHEVGHALKLLLRGDGSTLERILAPEQVATSYDLAELRRLCAATVNRRFYHHYRGFAKGIRSAADTQEQPTLPHILSACRTALTGAHLLRTGECRLSLPDLAARYGVEQELAPLLQRHRAGEQLISDPDAPWVKLVVKLQALVEEAIDQSELPTDPPNPQELEQYLLDVRRRFFDAITIEQ